MDGDSFTFDNGWEELWHNALYQRYQCPAHARDWFERVLAGPGCFCVEGGAHMGKTALIRELWLTLSKAGYSVIGYLFNSERRSRVTDAIRLFRWQLRQLGLIEASLPASPDGSGAEEPLVMPWFPLDQAADRRPIAVLIDALDESDHSQRHLLDALLPRLPLDHTKLVVTSRLPLAEYDVVLDAILPPDTILKLGALSVEDVQALATRFGIAEAATLAPRIYRRTRGHPPTTAAICRSGDPELALKAHPTQLRGVDLLSRRERRQIEQQVAEGDQPLLRRLLATLAVAPAPLSFVELHGILSAQSADPPSVEALRRLCDQLARHLRMEEQYQLVSPDLRELIRHEEAQGSVYSADVRAARAAVAGWYRRRYSDEKGNTLRGLPRHVLWYAPQFMLETSDPASFVGERIFIDRRWRNAIDDGFETLADLREIVREAWRAAEQATAAPTRVLGATTCAIVFTSLVPAFPPDVVAHLVRRGLVTEAQARRYASTYSAAGEREQFARLLREPMLPALDPALERTIASVEAYPEEERAMRLNRLHRRLAVVGSSKRDLLLDALRDSLRQELHEVSTPEPGRPLPTLIKLLAGIPLVAPRPSTQAILLEGEADTLAATPLGGEGAEPMGLAYPQELSGSHTALLGEIAAIWAPDEPSSVEYYLEVTRLIAGSSRASYFDALITLAPAISRVFGGLYVQRLIGIVEAITESYP